MHVIDPRSNLLSRLLWDSFSACCATLPKRKSHRPGLVRWLMPNQASPLLMPPCNAGRHAQSHRFAPMRKATSR